MAKFDFVTNQDFRASLEADYTELNSCMQAKAWKAVHVLAGSIVEAVLTDYLLSSGYGKKNSVDTLKMDLSQLVAACKNEGVLSQKTTELSAAIKSYRNLIHPGRVIRLGETVNENGAKVAQALVEIVIEEVSAKRRETYGYTAEQIVSKLERDPSAVDILMHLLKSVNESEIERLLLEIIPDQYFKTLDLISEEYYPENILSPLEKCFRFAFNVAPKHVSKKVVKRFVTILKEESGYHIHMYEAAFLKCEDLQFLSGEDVAVIVQHLCSKMEKDITEGLLKTMEGIGKFLTVDDVGTFVDTMIQTIIRGKYLKLKTMARDCIENEYEFMADDVQKKFASRLEDWAAHFRKNKQDEFVEIVEHLQVSLNSFNFAELD